MCLFPYRLHFSFLRISGFDAFGFAGMLCDNLTDFLLSFQAETMKINASNMFLQGQIKVSYFLRTHCASGTVQISLYMRYLQYF